MADRTLIVSITGIVVSGVVGPAMTAWATRIAQSRQFVRDREGKRRDELLALLDSAAVTLGSGPTKLREMATGAPSQDPAHQSWAEEVFTVGQRLRLRLGPSSELFALYETARARLLDAAQAGAFHTDTPQSEALIEGFETARGAFLDAAQTALAAKVSHKEKKR